MYISLARFMSWVRNFLMHCFFPTACAIPHNSTFHCASSSCTDNLPPLFPAQVSSSTNSRTSQMPMPLTGAGMMSGSRVRGISCKGHDGGVQFVNAPCRFRCASGCVMLRIVPCFAVHHVVLRCAKNGSMWYPPYRVQMPYIFFIHPFTCQV